MFNASERANVRTRFRLNWRERAQHHRKCVARTRIEFLSLGNIFTMWKGWQNFYLNNNVRPRAIVSKNFPMALWFISCFANKMTVFYVPFLLFPNANAWPWITFYCVHTHTHTDTHTLLRIHGDDGQQSAVNRLSHLLRNDRNYKNR